MRVTTGYTSSSYDPIDIKKAFDSKHWDILRLHGTSVRITGPLTGIYFGRESGVKCGGRGVQFLSCKYRSEAGVRPCTITFQHRHGLNTRQRCGPVIVEHTRTSIIQPSPNLFLPMMQ